jgi:hypothetical protein
MGKAGYSFLIVYKIIQNFAQQPLRKKSLQGNSFVTIITKQSLHDKHCVTIIA